MNFILRISAAVLTVVLLIGPVMPAQAQMEEDEELPTVDFSVNLMQSGQALAVDDNNPYSRPELDGSHSGFHQVRTGLTVSAQFSERVSGLLNIEAEPNDFGQNGFSPEIDLVFIDLALTDELTLRTGTPVTGLLNFRGFSDGPAVQGNPLIGNSPADMITAAHGIQLLGSYDAFGFDIAINRSFAEGFTSQQTGVNFIAKARFTGSDLFQFGGGFAAHTGDGVTPNGDQSGSPGVVFANGDRENYNFPGTGINSTETHVNMPAGTIFQADSKVSVAGLSNDLWVGYATESDFSLYEGDSFNALFLGLGTRIPFNESFYAAGRFTYVGDQSDAVSDSDHTAVSRIQVGFGYQVLERALFKAEYVRQVEGADTALSRIGNNWSGVTAELSVAF
jgi:hypothetical protein